MSKTIRLTWNQSCLNRRQEADKSFSKVTDELQEAQ